MSPDLTVYVTDLVDSEDPFAPPDAWDALVGEGFGGSIAVGVGARVLGGLTAVGGLELI